MCYQESYNCIVNCLNSDLNMTNINNNIISSMQNNGYGCKIISCNIIPIPEPSIFDIILTFNFAPLLIFLCILLITGLIYFIWYYGAIRLDDRRM